MTISDRARASIKNVPEKDQPLVEQFRIVAKQYAEAESEWYFMSEFKSAMLEQMKSNLIARQGEMPDNRAERIVKSGIEWEDWVRKMADAKKASLLLRMQLDYLKMKERHLDREHWDGRSERKMGRTAT